MNYTQDLIDANNQAKVYYDNKQFAQALELLNRQDLPVNLLPNLAKCYYYTGQAHKALEIVESLPYKSEEIMIDIALYKTWIGQQDEAYDIYKSLDQTNPKVQFNIGWHYLRRGEFKKGFQNIQYGGKARAWGNEYIYIEQGIIDKKNKWDG